MVTIVQTLTEISQQMQTFDDLEQTSRSLNARICHETSVNVYRVTKNDVKMEGLP